jgi:hypothetical protein
MSRKLAETLGLPSLDEIMAETDENNSEIMDTMMAVASSVPIEHDADEKDHSDAMDELYDEVRKHASEIVDLAYNLDPARAPRMLEVGAQYYKVALDAKNSKRDAQMKSMKLKMDCIKAKFEMGEGTGTKAETYIVEDRNEIIRNIREQRKLDS